MRRRIKRQLVRLSYPICGICLICCFCLTGCRKETKNAAVQDTVPAMEMGENPGMAGSSEAVNPEQKNKDAGRDRDETAAGEEKENRDKGTNEMNRNGAEEDGTDRNHEEMEKRTENGRNAGQTTGNGNEKASDGTGETAAEGETEIRDSEQSAEGKPDIEQHSHSFRIAEVTKQPGCMEQGSRTEICTVCGTSRETGIEALGHDMVTQWYGDPPDCTHGGYQAVLCLRCGWVDEAACGNVPPLEHIPAAVETQHGNCREDTIIIYTCSRCGEQTGYDRHTEPDEHKWVWKDTQVWDEEACEFVTIQIECCERCNVQP